MKIAILCNEVKPVPAVKGGAVETLVDLLIKNNESYSKPIDITVYSKYDKKAEMSSKGVKNTNFKFIKYNSLYETSFTIVEKILAKFRLKKFMYFTLTHPYVINVTKELREQKYDWIIVENRPLYINYLRKYLKNENIALHLHNDTINVENSYSVKVIQLFDKVLSVSDYISRRILQVCESEDSYKIRTLENRIDTNQFKPNKTYESFLSKKYKFTQEDLILLYHGRIIPEKGVLELIKAFKKALRKNSFLKLVIIGELNEGNYVEEVRNELNSLPQNKVILTNYVEHSHLPKYLNGGDIIILPSLWSEPFGLTIVESMAVGKPIISTRVGAIPEILSDDCGVLVDVNENLIDNLSNQILRVSSDKEYRVLLGKQAREKVVNNYGSELYLCDLIHKLKE
ncbi:hypothetical protein A2U94_12255 [Bacillus sp. VT 712]|uniref:glycosyltransferase family 4 protein n=1 Tax=Bacillaceae TaxID=186817 RepID=UPI0007A50EFA|nr:MULTISPECIES: glycosyltransferase family 4 protein [Bacillaceae]KZB91139.1 hypothetical protein A2U94_12255 [Bacillus sp. VT 712]WEZ07908.1 glycosyltransferase family 4 protein [Priestia flexa]